MATAPKRTTYTSPKGTFKYPSLSKPDYGNEKFPKPDGEFKTAVVMSIQDAQPLIKQLQVEWDTAIKLGKEAFAEMAVVQRKKFGSVKEQPFYETEYDPDTEQETGNVIFKVKTKYKIMDKKTGEARFNRIGLFDAKGKPLAAGTSIYGGTVGKVAFQTSPYFIAGQAMAGLSLRLSGVQVIDLVGPGERSSSSMGFGVEEGYEAEEAPTFESSVNGDPDDF